MLALTGRAAVSLGGNFLQKVSPSYYHDNLTKDRIIFALDVQGIDEAVEYVRLLKGHVGVFKVGLELFISTGPAIIKAVRDAGAEKIFLDMKFQTSLRRSEAHCPLPRRLTQILLPCTAKAGDPQRRSPRQADWGQGSRRNSADEP